MLKRARPLTPHQATHQVAVLARRGAVACAVLVVLSGRSLAAIPERERALRGKLELRVFALCKVDGEEHLVLTLGPLDLRAVCVCVCRACVRARAQEEAGSRQQDFVADSWGRSFTRAEQHTTCSLSRFRHQPCRAPRLGEDTAACSSADLHGRHDAGCCCHKCWCSPRRSQVLPSR